MFLLIMVGKSCDQVTILNDFSQRWKTVKNRQKSFKRSKMDQNHFCCSWNKFGTVEPPHSVWAVRKQKWSKIDENQQKWSKCTKIIKKTKTKISFWGVRKQTKTVFVNFHCGKALRMVILYNDAMGKKLGRMMIDKDVLPKVLKVVAKVVKFREWEWASYQLESKRCTSGTRRTCTSR